MRSSALAFAGILLTACSQPAPTPPATTRIQLVEGRWYLNGELTYPGSAAEGLLMNVRMVNSVFEDQGPEGLLHLPSDFDPDINTQSFVARIPEYVSAGVLAFTLNLQGGMPGYEGALNSAFEADGSLRGEYLARVKQVIEACDRAGAVVILGCFYQRQHSHLRALRDREAIRQAVRNAAGWIRSEGFENVFLEISNEYRHPGFLNWNDGQWLVSAEGQVELIRLAQEEGLLVSTSGMGDGRLPESIAAASDFLLIHFNSTPVEEIPERVEALRRYGKAIVCNEDDKIGEEAARAAEASVKSGASWGFMHNRKNQYVPFEFDGVDDDPLVYSVLRGLTRSSEGALRP